MDKFTNWVHVASLMNIDTVFMSDEDWFKSASTRITVSSRDGNHVVCFNEHETPLKFAKFEDAIKAAYEVAHEKDYEIKKMLEEHYKLDFSKWKYLGNGLQTFSLIGDGAVSLSFFRSEWSVRLDGVEVAKGKDIDAVLSQYEAAAYLDSCSLRLLDSLYAYNGSYYTEDLNEPYFQALLDRGAVSFTIVDENYLPVAVLEEKGKDLLNADPRTLHTDLRDVILREAKDKDERVELNGYMSVSGLGLFSNNGRALYAALLEGLEFEGGYAANEPFEIALKGNGETKDGALVRDQNIMLMCPAWDKSENTQCANRMVSTIIRKRDDLIEVARRLENPVSLTP